MSRKLLLLSAGLATFGFGHLLLAQQGVTPGNASSPNPVNAPPVPTLPVNPAVPNVPGSSPAVQPGFTTQPGISVTTPLPHIPGTATPGDGSYDPFLSTCLALGSQEELSLARFGRDNAHRADVKRFADAVVTDHEKFLKRLRPLAPDETTPGLLDEVLGTTAAAADKIVPDAKIEQAQTQQAQRNPRQRAASEELNRTAHRGGGELTQIEIQLATKCLAYSKKRLSETSGSEFDKSFLEMQIWKHTLMKNRFETYRAHVSAPLGRILTEGEKITDGHLATAEKLLKSIKDQELANVRGSSPVRPQANADAK